MYKSKLGKLVSNIAIIGIFAIALFSILMCFKVIKPSRGLIDFLIILGIVCVGAISSRVLLKLIDRRKNKVPLYVGLGLTAISCLLWIIFVFIGQGLIDNIIKETAQAKDLINILLYLKFAVIVTIFNFLYTFIITMIYLLKKDKFALQVISIASALVTDFWVSALIISCNVDDGGFKFTGKWLLEKGILTVAIIALVFLMISFVALRKIYKHSSEDMYLDAADNTKVEKEDSVDTSSIEARIKKLDELKAKGMISDEEYAEKKKRIIDEL